MHSRGDQEIAVQVIGAMEFPSISALDLGEFRRFVSELRNPQEYYEILESWKKGVTRLLGKPQLERILWEATRRCDLRCRHCGSPSEATSGKELSKAEAIELFREIYHDFDLGNSTYFQSLALTGGEPFVRKDLLAVLSGLKEIGYQAITIQTNGNFLARNAWVISELHSVNVLTIGTNLDGLEETHNWIRGNGNSFRNSLRTVEETKKRGMGIVVNTCIHKRNFPELAKLAEIVYSLQPETWRFLLLDPMGRGKGIEDYLLSADELRGLFVFMIKHRDLNVQRPEATQIEVEAGCTGWPGLDIALHLSSYSVPYCIGGIVQMGVLHDGKIGGCSNIDCELNVQGDWRNGDRIIDVWEKKFSTHRRKSKLIGDVRKVDCGDCTEWDYCHGGPAHRWTFQKKKGIEINQCLFRKINDSHPKRIPLGCGK